MTIPFPLAGRDATRVELPHLPRPLSPDEFEQAALLGPADLGQAKFPVLPPLAPRDATRTGPEAPNPQATRLSGLARILTQYVAAPLLEHPLATAVTTLTPGAAYLMGGLMAKDVVEYASQKAAESTLPDDVRALAERDPERIPGERAAVEAAMLGVGPLVHAVVKGVRGAPAELPSSAITAPIEGAGTSAPSGVAAAVEAPIIPEPAPVPYTAAQRARMSATLFDVARNGGDRRFGVPDPAAAPAAGAAPQPEPPVLAAVRAHVARVSDAWKVMFAPVARAPEARAAANIWRATTGEQAAAYEQAAFKLDEFRRAIEPLPMADKLGFIDAIEGGHSQASPAFADAAATIRATLDETRDAVRALGTGQLEHFNTNYFPHIWSDPAQAAEAFATLQEAPTAVAFEGSKAFLKPREIPTIAEGLALGLTPVSTNPVDLTLLKLREMQKYLVAHQSLNEMRDAGFVHYVRAGEVPPEGTSRINDKITTVFGPRQGGVTIPEGAVTALQYGPGGRVIGAEPLTPDQIGVQGMRIMGEYYAPEPVARIVNNYLAPGLRGNALYDAYRGLGNTLNQAQLGLSAFHLMFTSMDASVSRAALGLEYIATGQPLTGLREILSAPAAPVTNMRLGARVRAAYLTPEGAPPDMLALANAVKEAGGRVRMDSFYKDSAPERMMTALHAGEYGKAAALSLPALFETAAKPIMEYIVPMQKLGVFGDLAAKVLRELPAEATIADRRAALASAWDSVDNRMGQLVYDNLFWSKTFKDLAMASVRSVGWNIGTIRELGGGLTDVAAAGAKITRGQATELTHRAAYVMALPITVGFYGALYQYLRTGEGPRELKDYFYPRTGEADPDGNPERVQIASYMKDFFAYAGDPWQTVKHKLSPFLSSASEMLENQDFYGDQIRNPNDPAVHQLLQEAKYMAEQLTPFAWRNMLEGNARGDQSTVTKLGSWFGITPAPRRVVRTDAQNKMADYLSERRMSGATPEDAAARQSRAEILAGLRGGAGVDLSQAVTDAIERHQLTTADVAQLLKRAGTTPAVERFKRLTMPQALDVFKRGTPHEQQLFAEALVAKVSRAIDAGEAPATLPTP